MVSGRFAPVSPLTLKTIAGYNEGKKVNMMFAGAFINSECAKLGYLLSRLAGEGRHYSFFGNSAHEAVAGAVKLARHHSVRAKRDDDGWILVVDGSGYFKPYLDPLNAGEDKAIAPHLSFVTSVEEALERVEERKWAAVLLVRTEETEQDEAGCGRLLDLAGDQGALRIVSSSELEAPYERLFASGLPADVHVLGENLAGREVPFGCFVMSAKAYEVWNNPTDSLAHTSTFGGNGICLAVVLDVLRREGLVTDEDEQLFSRIDHEPEERGRYFRRHVNPHAANGMQTFGFDLDIARADGGRLTLTDGRILIDCCGGTGASLRGHNPSDLVPEVLDSHEPHHDYFADLEELLGEVSRFPHALPAVSGATAVEIGLGMALLARPDRTKVITFKGNYSGKSLASLNLSKYGPTAASTDSDAFRPYYFDLVYVDPFEKGAADHLAELLRAGDVAVVWFEYIQGMRCLPLPDDVIRTVNDLKREHGYLIGVDEVLSGAWRGGEHFLAHHDVVPGCDISTLAKPLSDMTLPMAATLVTNEVLERAKATDAEHVERLQHNYRNGLGAHIAVHGLSWAMDPARRDRRLLQQKRLRAAMDELAEESRLFESVEGLGAHIRLVPRRRWFPFKSRSMVNQMLESSLQNLILTRTGVLLGQQRFFHGIFADDEDVEIAIARLRPLSGVRPAAVYWNAVACVYAAFRTSRAKKRKHRT